MHVYLEHLLFGGERQDKYTINKDNVLVHSPPPPQLIAASMGLMRQASHFCACFSATNRR